jgi:hypothetical protein
MYDSVNSEMADFSESENKRPRTINHVSSDFNPITLYQTLLKEE